jgi:DNA (cytosine-5)-methyltransferase 1
VKYLSVCSGIEAATVAWHPLGWEPVAFSEIEKFPSAVLAHHYPTVPNCGDMTKFKEWPDADINVLVGGTPCQSFSVAGLRKGLDDPRGNLMLTYLAIADRYRPKWLVWENVPGVLSSNGGRDFGTFLGGLGQLGYGFAYRVLDAQYIRTQCFPRAVAQRRRRVFVVGCLGDWRSAAAVLFERESLSGHPAPSREARQGIASCVEGGVELCGPLNAKDYKDPGTDGMNRNSAKMVPVVQPVRGAITTRCGSAMGAPEVDAGLYIPVAQPVAFHHNAQASQLPTDARDTSISDSLTVSQQAAVALPVAFKVRGGVEVDSAGKAAGKGYLGSEETAFTLAATQDQWVGTPPAMQVRRLTPVECERLQGFPDGYTNIPWRKKPEAADGPRYKALGNLMAVPCMQWIGERIAKVEAL